ncbi:MAG: hypothetical protein RIC06_22420 [Cyclobacteriaceae bacterium]
MPKRPIISLPSRVYKTCICLLLVTPMIHACEEPGVIEDPEIEPNLVMKLTFDSTAYTTEEKILMNHELVDLVENEGTNSSNGIRVNYVGDDRGSKRIVQNIRLPRALTEATLNFEVKFEEGFRFVKGGKLNGLGPIEKVTGGDPIHPNGWSARIMFKESGKVTPYIYHQDMKGQYGEGNTTSDPVFTPGTWQKVAIYMKINKPADASNGVFQLWIDNELVSEMTGLKYRGNEGSGTLINYILFSTFHGGSNPDWAPKDQDGNYTIEKALFDDIYLYEGKLIRE